MMTSDDGTPMATVTPFKPRETPEHGTHPAGGRNLAARVATFERRRQAGDVQDILGRLDEYAEELCDATDDDLDVPVEALVEMWEAVRSVKDTLDIAVGKLERHVAGRVATDGTLPKGGQLRRLTLADGRVLQERTKGADPKLVDPQGLFRAVQQRVADRLVDDYGNGDDTVLRMLTGLVAQHIADVYPVLTGSAHPRGSVLRRTAPERPGQIVWGIDLAHYTEKPPGGEPSFGFYVAKNARQKANHPTTGGDQP